jgi:hypothetical protein
MPDVSKLGGALVVAALSFGCRASAPPTPPYDYRNGEDIVRAMFDRYLNRWFDNVTYLQQNRSHAPGRDTLAEIWYVAIDPPRRMRIDFHPLTAGNGALIVGDNEYAVASGRAGPAARALQGRMLLQHDVYFLTPPETIARLRELGFDLSRAREDSWEGRPVFVVGSAGDARAPQFWVDRELMLLVRLLEPSLRDPGAVTDTRLLEYERIGSAWIPRRIDVFDGGVRTYSQQIREIRVNVPIDSLLFVPDQWARARHWYQQPILR